MLTGGVSFAYLTVGPDGRVYVAWAQSDYQAAFQRPERLSFWLRIAPAGSTRFGPARLVAVEPRNLNLAYLHGRDFAPPPSPRAPCSSSTGGHGSS